jgi:surfeit locus 1 family protein
MQVQMSSFAAAVACALFIALGFWQLDRAEQKRALHNEYLLNRDKPALVLNNLHSNYDFASVQGREVEADGTFLNRFLLLDNQSLEGRAGYSVLTPYEVRGAGYVIMVNLGWVAMPGRRDALPPLADSAERPDRLRGRLAAPPAVGLLLPGAEQREDLTAQITRVQIIDFDQIGNWLRAPVAPVLVEIDPDVAWGYKKIWRVPGSGEERHQAYATQWFAFAAIVVLLWFFLRVVKRDRT